MSSALVLADAGRRENGRWARDTSTIPASGNKTWLNNLNMAGVVLDYAPDLAIYAGVNSATPRPSSSSRQGIARGTVTRPPLK